MISKNVSERRRFMFYYCDDRTYGLNVKFRTPISHYLSSSSKNKSHFILLLSVFLRAIGHFPVEMYVMPQSDIQNQGLIFILNNIEFKQSLKSIFYKIDIGKSFMSKIPLFLPRFFVNIIYQKRPQYQHFSAHEGGGGSKVQKICLKNRD